MGQIIDKNQFDSLESYHHVAIITNNTCENAISLNKLLAEELLKLKPRRRTLQLENCFSRVLSKLPMNCIIKDFDVMFNPEYKIDILRILTEQNKSHPFSAVWPGTYDDGRLIYGEEGYSDYKTYNINDYDILCVI